LDVSLFDLVKTFQTVLERAKSRPIYEVGKEDVNVPDMIRFLRDTLMRTPRSQLVSVIELFERQRSPRAMLCLFLAILELVKRQAIHLQQKEAFGDILVRPAENFEQALGSEQAIAAAEQEYK
jgi:segregation and condensation protein A